MSFKPQYLMLLIFCFSFIKPVFSENIDSIEIRYYINDEKQSIEGDFDFKVKCMDSANSMVDIQIKGSYIYFNKNYIKSESIFVLFSFKKKKYFFMLYKNYFTKTPLLKFTLRCKEFLGIRFHKNIRQLLISTGGYGSPFVWISSYYSKKEARLYEKLFEED